MSWIFPTYHFKNVLAIDERIFDEKKLLIFDIDNTLFFPESTKIDPRILAWFKKIQKTYPCICLSNSHTIRKRKRTIEAMTGCPLFVGRHKKPSRKLFRDIQRRYRVPAHSVAVIGDMRFTDVLFGNRCGATTVLVEPLSSKELFSIRIARMIENSLVLCVRLFRE